MKLSQWYAASATDLMVVNAVMRSEKCFPCGAKGLIHSVGILAISGTHQKAYIPVCGMCADESVDPLRGHLYLEALQRRIASVRVQSC